MVSSPLIRPYFLEGGGIEGAPLGSRDWWNSTTKDISPPSSSTFKFPQGGWPTGVTWKPSTWRNIRYSQISTEAPVWRSWDSCISFMSQKNLLTWTTNLEFVPSQIRIQKLKNPAGQDWENTTTRCRRKRCPSSEISKNPWASRYLCCPKHIGQDPHAPDEATTT